MANLNHFAVLVAGVLLYLAVMGWLNVWCTRRGGTTFEHLISSLIAFVWAGLFMVVVMVTNVVLATTGIERSWGSEALDRGRGFLMSTLFTGSGLRSNELLALAIVIGSFISAGYFLREIGNLASAFRNGTWRQRSAMGTIVARFAIAAAFASIALYTDRAMLLFRTVTMMYPEELATVPSDLPSVASIMKTHQGTQGATMLSVLACWYPAIILLAEKHYASSRARLSEAARLHHANRAQLGGHTPGIAPAPPAMVPLAVAPAQQPGNGGAPGGAAHHVRAIPFNPGPRN